MDTNFVFVGLADVGNEIAPNLLEAGFKAADGVSTADIVFTYTPFIEDSEELYFGSDGMISAAKEGAFLVNLAPVSPSLQHEIYALAQVSGMTAVDAPLIVRDVSREHAFADRGNLCMFVGANDRDFDVLHPVLDALSAKVVYCGGVGTGQLSRAAVTLQRAAAVVGMVEADALCRVVQDDDASAASSVMQRSLDALSANTDAALLYAAIAQRSFASSYTAAVLLGEVVAALSTADDHKLILPQAESAEYLLKLLLTIGGSEMGAGGLSLLYAEEAECARFGLDWSRADEFYDAMDYDEYDDYDDYDDQDDDTGRNRGFGHGDGFGFGPYSPN